MKLLDVVNPATDELITQLRIDDGAAVAIKAQKARNAQAAWAATPLADRMVCIQRFRALVVAQLEDLAKTMTQETGKPLAHSHNELNGFLGRVDFSWQKQKVFSKPKRFTSKTVCASKFSTSHLV